MYEPEAFVTGDELRRLRLIVGDIDAGREVSFGLLLSFVARGWVEVDAQGGRVSPAGWKMLE